MFRSPQNYRTFLTILLTYALDQVGFSIVFPVLAPLLLNTDLHFFSAETVEATRTTVLGLLFGVFGIAQFFGASVVGALADHYGRYKIFLWTVGLSILGYALMAFSIYQQSLEWIFMGRILTGLCSGNSALAQSATADLTDEHHRSKAFGVLMGVGGLGWVAGPWIGGKLANPNWLSGSGAFIFAAIAALLNLFMVYFFYIETWKQQAEQTKIGLMKTFKDIRLVFHQKTLRIILTASLFFSIGWAFFLIFSPTFLVQRFSLGSDKIGDFFAYMALVWFFASMFLNKELAGKFSLRVLILAGIVLASLGVGLFLLPSDLWPYWIIIPIALTGGALGWINLSAILSTRASEHIQGRAMGAAGSMWAIGQIVAPLVAGPLAGWNIYSPLLVGVVFILITFIYFICSYRESPAEHK
jgi:DHA1 family tetracycline resistance protein-like MFS transporter